MARLPPFEVEIASLGPRGTGIGTAPDGRPVRVQRAPPGARVLVVPQGRRRGEWTARRVGLVRPAPGWAVPDCPQFGVCGGCSLQELGLAAQREAKLALAMAEVGPTAALTVHPLVGAPDAYHYRNKLELTFGSRAWLPEERRHDSIDGRFLGFHAPGRFDRVVDAPTCSLAGPAAARAIAAARPIALHPDSPPPYDPRDHTGFWRSLVLRESRAGDLIAAIYTSSAEHRDVVARLATALVDDAGASGVAWILNSGLADVSRGTALERWGATALEEHLAGRVFRLSHTAFFQTNTAAAEILYAVVAEAAGRGGALLDLYCGIGSIGIALSPSFDRVIGIEEVSSAVEDARENAARNRVRAEYALGRVEDLLRTGLAQPGDAIVVDPPRVGLHPTAAATLATADARVLVYVACNPASLGRDRAVLEQGGWRATDLWAVDLFPQTGHVEVVMRFARIAGAAA